MLKNLVIGRCFASVSPTERPKADWVKDPQAQMILSLMQGAADIRAVVPIFGTVEKISFPQTRLSESADNENLL